MLAGALTAPGQSNPSFIDSWSRDFPNEFAKYQVLYPGAKEVLGWPWYDTQTYVSGATTALTQWFNTRNTPDLSNMVTAYQLPAENGFLARSISLFVKQRPRVVTPLAAGGYATGALDNIAQLVNTGVFTLTIGAKPYMQLPLWRITAAGGPSGVMALSAGPASTGTSIDYAQNGIPDTRAGYTLTKPLFIPPLLNFSATITWPAAVTLTENLPLCMLLDGDLVRPVQ